MPAVLPAVAAAPPPAAIRDTIAAVFSNPGYDASLRRSLGDRILDWIGRLISAGYDALRGSADIRWMVIAVAVVIAVVIIARAFYLAGVAADRGRRRPRTGTPRFDPWRASADAARSGRHTEAAHLLYVAVLESLAERYRVRLHPSRTPREYERELRRRAPAAVAAYAAFVREYEPVVWRNRSCDETTYRMLDELARAVAAPAASGMAA